MAEAVPARAADPAIWRIVAVAALGPLMTNLDATAVNVALPAMGRTLGAPVSTIQWVASAYLLALALMLPLTGWLVDRIGLRKAYLGCFAGFTLASLLCGMAHSAPQLIAARVMQGMAGGVLTPLAQLAVARAAGSQLARFMGIVSMPVLLGAILGPVVAGALVQALGWPSIFFLNLPIGIAAIVLTAALLPRTSASSQVRTFDLTGFLLLAPGLAIALFGLERVGAGRDERFGGIGAVAVAALLMASFLGWARRRGPRALIDLRLFSDRIFATASATQFLANGAVLGGQLLLPLFLLDGLHLRPTTSGWLLGIVGVGALCSYPMIGSLVARFGARTVTLWGAGVGLAGMLPFLLALPGGPSTALLVAALALRGLSIGAISVPSIAVAYRDMSAATIAQATTALNIVQRLGGPVATTAIALAFSPTSHTGASTFGMSMFADAFLLLAAIHALLALTALGLPRRRDAPIPQPDPVHSSNLKVQHD